MEGMQLLEEKWGQLRLLEEEQNSITVGEEVLEEDRIKVRRSLVGRVCSERNIIKLFNQQWGKFGSLTEQPPSRKQAKISLSLHYQQKLKNRGWKQESFGYSTMPCSLCSRLMEASY